MYNRVKDLIHLNDKFFYESFNKLIADLSYDTPEPGTTVKSVKMLKLNIDNSKIGVTKVAD